MESEEEDMLDHRFANADISPRQHRDNIKKHERKNISWDSKIILLRNLFQDTCRFNWQNKIT